MGLAEHRAPHACHRSRGLVLCPPRGPALRPHHDGGSGRRRHFWPCLTGTGRSQPSAAGTLMERQMAHFRRRDGRALFLNTSPDNPAYEAYRRRGFVPVEPQSGAMVFAVAVTRNLRPTTLPPASPPSNPSNGGTGPARPPFRRRPCRASSCARRWGIFGRKSSEGSAAARGRWPARRPRPGVRRVQAQRRGGGRRRRGDHAMSSPLTPSASMSAAIRNFGPTPRPCSPPPLARAPHVASRRLTPIPIARKSSPRSTPPASRPPPLGPAGSPPTPRPRDSRI